MKSFALVAIFSASLVHVNCFSGPSIKPTTNLRSQAFQRRWTTTFGEFRLGQQTDVANDSNDGISLKVAVSKDDRGETEGNEEVNANLNDEEHNANDSIPKQASVNNSEHTVEFELRTSITSIPASDWDSCLVDGVSSPFVKHAWLSCLEESKCVSPTTGWVPQHVAIRVDGELAGFVPLYLKSHSMGEFIFDQQFADAAYSNGIEYYPKLLVGIPFTPATGRRILWTRSFSSTVTDQVISQLNRAVGEFLKRVANSNGLSSVHCNFLTDDEASDLAGPLQPRNFKDDETLQNKVRSMLAMMQVKDNYLRRTSLQYHWHNRNPNDQDKPFQSFDDYLACFKSKRRINIRRERRKVLEDENVRVDAIVGREILKYDGLVERMFEIYRSTIDKMVWGRQYLTLDFFKRLAESNFVDNLVFMCARYNTTTSNEFKAEDVFAGTVNIVDGNVFYGRYWGCLPEYEIKNLHFETCYWSAIDFCIQNGLQRMEPGAGGGDYKWARGFNPALIHSVHYICHPGLRRAVGQFLDYETENNVELTEYLNERSAVRATIKSNTS